MIRVVMIRVVMIRVMMIRVMMIRVIDDDKGLIRVMMVIKDSDGY